MTGTNTIISLLGAVALLLWGLRMVRTSVTRAFGKNLQMALKWGLKNRLTAFAAGLGVTIFIQSSAGTALLMTSFAKYGIVETAPSLAVLLGADVGTALVTQFLSLDLSFLIPLLLFDHSP